MTTRTAAIAFGVVLLVVLIATVADAKGYGKHVAARSAESQARHNGDRVDRLPTRTVERLSIAAAAEGGIRSHRYGDASPWLRRLSRELVARAFRGDSERWALCVVGRESGFNPGAISSTNDHGLPQINRPSHPWVNFGRIVVDPPYAVAVMVRLSNHGRSRSAWAGGSRAC